MVNSVAAITLPRLLGARGSARSIVRKSVRKGTQSVAINALDNESLAQGAADEIVKQLIQLDVQRVIVVNPTARGQKFLQDSHDRRSRDSSAFLLLFQNRKEDFLMREV